MQGCVNEIKWSESKSTIGKKQAHAVSKLNRQSPGGQAMN